MQTIPAVYAGFDVETIIPADAAARRKIENSGILTLCIEMTSPFLYPNLVSALATLTTELRNCAYVYFLSVRKST